MRLLSAKREDGDNPNTLTNELSGNWTQMLASQNSHTRCAASLLRRLVREALTHILSSCLFTSSSFS